MVLLLLVFVVSSCSAKSIEETLNDAKIAAETVFKNEQLTKTNYDLDDISFYLPKKLVVKEKVESNIILEDGKQTYIVFYNEHEKPTSKLYYKTTENDEALSYKSFKDDSKFGYLQILPDEGKGFEMQVGIGGVKITTYTKKRKMEKDAEELMKIVKSIAIPNEDTN